MQHQIVERLSKPLLSRFTVFEIPEYTYEEFEAISVRIIKKKIPHNIIVQIASSVWKSGSKDVRDCIKISKLATAKDTEEDIKRLISIHQKYRRTTREYNWQLSLSRNARFSTFNNQKILTLKQFLLSLHSSTLSYDEIVDVHKNYA